MNYGGRVFLLLRFHPSSERRNFTNNFPTDSESVVCFTDAPPLTGLDQSGPGKEMELSGLLCRKRSGRGWSEYQRGLIVKVPSDTDD